MVEENFNLQWKSHTDYMRQTLHQMMSDTSLTDVTLVSSDQAYFKAHKAILSAGSSIFHDIVNQTKVHDPFIFMRGIDGFILKSILSFIYLGEVSIEHQKIDEFLKSSKDLAIRGLCINDSEANLGNLSSINNTAKTLDDEATMVKEETMYEQDQEGTEKDMKDPKNSDNEPEQQFKYGQDQDGLNESNSPSEKAVDSTGSDNDPEQHLLDEVEQEGIDEDDYFIKKSEEEKRKKHSPPLYGCQLCGKIYPREFHLNQHFNSKKNCMKVNSSVKYKCDQCDFTGQTIQLVRLHRCMIHANQMIYHCKNCPRFFMTKRLFTRHTALQHDDKDSMFFCEHCEFQTLHKTKLKEHIRVTHRLFRRNCDLCGETFISLSDINRHIKEKHQV